MSDMMEVRDHSQPCEHERWSFLNNGLWDCGDIDCPGGKRIVLRKTKHSKTDATPDLWMVEVSDDE